MYNVTYVYTYVFSLLRLILCQSLCWPPRRTKGAFQKNDLALLNGAVSLLPPWNLPCWPMIDLWYPIIISTYWARHQLTSAQLFSARQQDPVYTYNYTVYIHIYIYTWLNTVPTCWFMLIHCTLMLMLYLNGACGGCSDRLWSQRREVPWKLAVRRARAERKSPTERTVDEHLSCVYLMYVDVRWCVLMYLDVCWCVMMCVDVCLCTLMYVNVCWCMLMCVDVWWCMLMCVDVCWCMLMFVDVCWCTLMCVDACWCMLMYNEHMNMDCKWIANGNTWCFHTPESFSEPLCLKLHWESQRDEGTTWRTIRTVERSSHHVMTTSLLQQLPAWIAVSVFTWVVCWVFVAPKDCQDLSVLGSTPVGFPRFIYVSCC